MLLLLFSNYYTLENRLVNVGYQFRFAGRLRIQPKLDTSGTYVPSNAEE
jgi:hypothetical protein